MKKIIEIFYEYLLNPHQKHILYHIISLSEKSQVLTDKFHIFKLIAEDKSDDSISSN